EFSLLFRTLELIVLVFSFALVSVNSLTRFRQFPEVDNYSDNEGSYIIAAVLVLVTLFFLLRKDGLLGACLTAWRGNKLLIAFLAYAVLTLLWSVYIPATFYKLLFLFFSTLVGSYLAVCYRSEGVLHILTWVGAVFAVLSIVVVAFFPMMGVMQNEIFF